MKLKFRLIDVLRAKLGETEDLDRELMERFEDIERSLESGRWRILT
ncbi:MAG: hypothetical protein GXO66_04510 [Euryarchaeota archaeon]|nr:hypothetical protein [Euryarchaeota archaeon]